MSGAIDIELSRGQAGLGFNIKGGTDVPHIPGDPGIFVAKIREKGAAAEDGRLKEGDKIIEINGNNVEKVLHKEAVGHFLNAGNTVTLKVISGAEAALKTMANSQKNSAQRPDSISTSKNTSSSSVSGPVILGLGLAALGVAIFIAYKYRR